MSATTSFRTRLCTIVLIVLSPAGLASAEEVIDKPARLFCRSSECSWPQTLELPAGGGKFELRCRSSEFPHVADYSFQKAGDTTCNEWQTRRESRVVACRAKDGSAKISEIVLHCRMRTS